MKIITIIGTRTQFIKSAIVSKILRRENIWNALLEIANKGIKIFFPVHPRIKKYLNLFNILQKRFPKI